MVNTVHKLHDLAINYKYNLNKQLVFQVLHSNVD